tara:strand:- start:13928 stop:15202 length:1275 start_codon:yes stop_codon:yes gene_type:complete
MSDVNKTYVFETVLVSGTTTTAEYITGTTFNPTTGNLNLETVSGNTITSNLDGRYSLTGHTHTTSEILDFPTSLSAFTNDEGFITEDTNDFVTGSTFNSEILGFTRLSGGTFNVDLSGTYSLTGHTHIISEISDFPTNISYFINDSGYITGFTDTNDYVSGGTFNTSNGILEFTNTTGGTFNVDLDGRYLTAETNSQTLSFSASTGNLEISNGNIVDLGFTSGDTGNWNEVYSWGDHSLVGYITGYTDTNDYVTGGTFNSGDGILEFTRLSGSTLNVDLDGRYSLTSHNHDEFYSLTGHTHDDRYSLTGHTHDSSEIIGLTDTTDNDYTTTAELSSGDTLNFTRLSGGTYSVVLTGLTGVVTGPVTFSTETLSGTTTYVGYGEINACKIRRIITSSGATYSAFWSNSEETLDKIWANRYSYGYF